MLNADDDLLDLPVCPVCSMTIDADVSPHDVIRLPGSQRQLAGLGLILAGLVMCFWPVTDIECRWWPCYFGILLCLFGLSVGFWLHRHILDRRHRVSRKWWGLFLPLQVEEQPLEAFGSLRILLEYHAGRHSPRRYHVEFVGSGETFRLMSFSSALLARQWTERIAVFLGLDFADAVTGRVFRQGQLVGAAESAPTPSRSVSTAALPPKPATSRITVSDSGTELAFEIPRPDQQRKDVLGAWFVGGLILLFGLAWAFVWLRDGLEYMTCATAAVVLLPSIYFAVRWFRTIPEELQTQFRLVLSLGNVRAEWISPGERKVKEIPATQLSILGELTESQYVPLEYRAHDPRNLTLVGINDTIVIETETQQDVHWLRECVRIVCLSRH